MRILEFVEQFYLHDSSLENLSYDAFKDQLILTVNLSNWAQDNFNKDVDQDHVIGNFIFNGVNEVCMNPHYFYYSRQNIINVDYIKNENGTDKLVFVVSFDEKDHCYSAGHSAFELSFVASSVEWQPFEFYNDDH